MNEMTAQNLHAFLLQREKEFEDALSNPEMKFAQECHFAKQQILKNDYSLQIARENPQSLKNAITNVAAIGISLNPALAQAYLVPRDGMIVLDVSYRGFIKLATDAGVVKWCRAELVYDSDGFEYYGAFREPKIVSNPFSPAGRGEIVGAYCVAKTEEGDFMTEIMTTEQINQVRDTSAVFIAAVKKGEDTSVWHKWYGEMARKTVIKRAAKTWPYSSGKHRLDKAVEVVNQHEGFSLSAFTVEEKETYDELMSADDCLAFFVFNKSLPVSTTIALHNSGAKGGKVALKERANELMRRAGEEVANYVAQLEDCCEEDALLGAVEIVDELSEDVREYLMNMLTPSTQEWLREGLRKSNE